VRDFTEQGADEARNDDLLLQSWLSPAFPIGGFAYSHGLEAAVENGDVADAASLRQWLLDLVEHGSIRNDLILIAAAMRATNALDDDAVTEINALALALAPSRERRLETQAQGDAFTSAVRNVWPCRAIETFATRNSNAAYPIALAIAAEGHRVDVTKTCRAFGLAFIANLVSAAVRLGPIGQTDGQRVIAALIESIARAAAFAASSALDDLGGSAIRSDIASMRHESQYSRLFRS
jgi:urease accessory protein